MNRFKPWHWPLRAVACLYAALNIMFRMHPSPETVLLFFICMIGTFICAAIAIDEWSRA